MSEARKLSPEEVHAIAVELADDCLVRCSRCAAIRSVWTVDVTTAVDLHFERMRFANRLRALDPKEPAR